MEKELDHIKTRLHEFEKKSTEWILKEQFNVVVNDIKNLQIQINVNTENLEFLTEDVRKLKAVVDAFDSPSTAEFDLLKTRVDQLENLIGNIRKQMEGVLNKVKNMNGGGADAGVVADLKKMIEKLRAEYDNFRDEVNRNLHDLNITMP